MSGLLAGKVWQSNLEAHLKPLAAAMADIANDDGTRIFPSVAYLAWLLGKGERSVQQGLSELKALGVIEAVAFEKGGRNHPTEYRLVEGTLPHRIPWKEFRKGATSAPFTSKKGATFDIKGCNLEQERVQISTERVKPTAPDPSVEPLPKPLVEPSSANGRATRLSKDFSLTPEMQAWAKINAPDVNLDAALPEFLDYWIAVGGAAGRKLDWVATWRNRMRVLQDRVRRNGNGSNQTGYESASQRNARNLRENAAYIRSLSNSGSAPDSEDPVGLLAAGS